MWWIVAARDGVAAKRVTAFPTRDFFYSHEKQIPSNENLSGAASTKKKFFFAPESCLPAEILAAARGKAPRTPGRRPYKAKRISISLDPDKFDKQKGDDALGVLLPHVLEIVNPDWNGDGRPSWDAKWIIRLALRGCLEEIIRTGHLPLPHDVTFTAYWSQRAPGKHKT